MTTTPAFTNMRTCSESSRAEAMRARDREVYVTEDCASELDTSDQIVTSRARARVITSRSRDVQYFASPLVLRS